MNTTAVTNVQRPGAAGRMRLVDRMTSTANQSESLNDWCPCPWCGALVDVDPARIHDGEFTECDACGNTVHFEFEAQITVVYSTRISKVVDR